MKTVLRYMLLLLMVVLFSSAQTSADQNKAIVVFVDLSSSVSDFETYREAWSKVVGRLKPGDRIALGAINHQTFTHFRTTADETVPEFNKFTENKLKYDKKVKETKAKLEKKFEATLNGSKSAKTDILNSLLVAEKFIRGDKRRPVLLFMSDMLEDSEAYNFERLKITDAFIRQVIEEKRKQKQLPDLLGAKVYVAGASAKSAGKALEVQRFWMEYVKAANGKLDSQNYGPALINFEE